MNGLSNSPAAVDSWTPVAERLPDDDTLVLLALSNEEVWPGFRDGDVWRYSDATPIESAQVTDWMHLPAAPKPKAAQSQPSSGAPDAYMHPTVHRCLSKESWSYPGAIPLYRKDGK